MRGCAMARFKLASQKGVARRRNVSEPKKVEKGQSLKLTDEEWYAVAEAGSQGMLLEIADELGLDAAKRFVDELVAKRQRGGEPLGG